MDVQKVIAALREERACLDEAIMGLEKLQSRRTPRRGRPRSWMTASSASALKKVRAASGIMKGGLSAAKGAKTANRSGPSDSDPTLVSGNQKAEEQHARS